jgi:hypothetical protein
MFWQKCAVGGVGISWTLRFAITMGKWLLQSSCRYGGPNIMVQSYRSSFTSFQPCAGDGHAVVVQRGTNNIRLRF